MSLIPRVILLMVLSSFTFTTTAAGILCSLSMSDKSGSQQFPEDTSKKSCHSDKKNSANESIEDCCQDMTLCGAATGLVSQSFSSKVQINHYSVSLSPNEYIILNNVSPPLPPPKLNS